MYYIIVLTFVSLISKKEMTLHCTLFNLVSKQDYCTCFNYNFQLLEIVPELFTV